MAVTIKIAEAPLSRANMALVNKYLPSDPTGRTRILTIPSHPEPGFLTDVNLCAPSRYHVTGPVSKDVAARISTTCEQLINKTGITEEENAQLWLDYSTVYPLLTKAPEYQKMIRSIADIIAPYLPEPARVLNLGAGTGAVEMGLISRMGLEAFSELRMVEIDQYMLGAARSTFEHLFEDQNVFGYTNSPIQDLQTIREDLPNYVRPGFNGIISSLVLPFLDRSDMINNLTAVHDMALPGAPIVHVIHKDAFNPAAIALRYVFDVTVGRARGSFYDGVSELLRDAESFKSIRMIASAIASNRSSLSLLSTDEWEDVFYDSGMTDIEKPVSLYSNQALMFFGFKG